jgi:hypothetical protein
VNNPITLTNPARRLHKLLSALKAVGGQTRFFDGVAHVFEVPNTDVAAVYNKFATFLRLIGTVERRCQSLSDPKAEQFLCAVTSIKEAFKTLNPAALISQVLNHVSNSDMALLFLAADFLDSFKEEAQIDAKTLSEINESADTLATEVAAGNLDSHLKILILDQLDSIREAVRDYKIRGAEGLKKALAESIGIIVLEQNTIAKERHNPFVEKFFDVLSKINTAVRSVELAHKLGDALAQVIASLPQ